MFILYKEIYFIVWFIPKLQEILCNVSYVLYSMNTYFNGLSHHPSSYFLSPNDIHLWSLNRFHTFLHCWNMYIYMLWVLEGIQINIVFDRFSCQVQHCRVGCSVGDLMKLAVYQKSWWFSLEWFLVLLFKHIFWAALLLLQVILVAGSVI